MPRGLMKTNRQHHQLRQQQQLLQQGVALTGRNTTGPQCRHCPRARRLARPQAALQTTTDASEQNNTGPLGEPVTIVISYLGCGFDGRTVFKQQFDDLYSVFLGGDMQRREAILCVQYCNKYTQTRLAVRINRPV